MSDNAFDTAAPHPEDYKLTISALAQYVMTKGTPDAEAAFEAGFQGPVLWVQRQGDSDQFHCAVLDTDAARNELMRRLYAVHAATLAPPYSEEEVGAFERFHDACLPAQLRFYLTSVSREVISPGGKRHAVALPAEAPLEANAAITQAHIEEVGIAGEDAASPALLAGCLALDDNLAVVVKGSGHGRVLCKTDAGYSLLTVWEALYRPFS